MSAKYRRGRFITFEGGEGAGKTTQQRALAQKLQELGVPTLVTREPGGTPGAEAVRAVLLSGAVKDRGPEAEALLFAAARAEHVDCVIRPALSEGIWVLCDRFADSTRVDPGGAGDENASLDALELVALDGVAPDLTFVLDLPAKVGLARIAGRSGHDDLNGGGGGDRFERDDLAIHQRRRQSFVALARARPERCGIVNGARPSTIVAERIWEATVSRLLAKG
jgi:dTMP kinase